MESRGAGAYPAFRAMVPNGRLFVPPSFVQTGSAEDYQVNAAADAVGMKFIAECDFAVSRLSLYMSAVGTEGNFYAPIFSHDATNDKPNADISGSNAMATGSGAGWKSDTMSGTVGNVQLTRGTIYWFVPRGYSTTDYTLTVRRWNTALSSMFMDSQFRSSFTDDTWSTQTECVQDSKPAMLNCFINGSANHVPPLMYGRYNGKYIDIPGSGIMEIPVAGVSFACDALTAGTLYYIYIYNNSGTLTLDATANVPTRGDEGYLVKTGATTRRYLGMIVPKNLVSTYQGPVDCMDSRLVMNHYNKIPKTLGKLCPYSGATADTGVLDSFEGWNGSATEWKFEFISDGRPIPVRYVANGITDSAESVYAALGLDAATPHEAVSGSQVYGETDVVSGPLVGSGELRVGLGYHYALPIQKAGAANSGDLNFEVAGTVYSGMSNVIGTIWC